MFIPAINATGAIQPMSPWAFCEYLPAEDPRYTSHYGLVLANTCFFPSNTAQFSYKPENVVRGPLFSGVVSRGPSNLSTFTEEPLDWDTGVEHAPPRPSGKISVTFRYAGRGTPRPLADY
jgi:hypothetical protein